MARTFSLGRLMVGVTLFCVVCGIAANFPEVAIGLRALIAFFAPTIFVFMVLSRFATSFGRLAGWVTIGAVLGSLHVPFVYFADGWNLTTINYLLASVPPALGALLIGLPMTLVEPPSQY